MTAYVSLLQTVFMLFGFAYLITSISRISKKIIKHEESINQKDEVYGYFVVFLVFKDHELRNAGVPLLERLTSGQACAIMSKCLVPDADKPAVFAPSRIGQLLFDSVQDGEVTGLNILSITPMRKHEIAAEASYVKEMTQKFAAFSLDQTTSTTEEHK